MQIKDYALLALTLALILVIIFRPVPEPNNQYWKDALKTSEDARAILNIENGQLKTKIQQDSILQAEQKIEFEKKITTLTKDVAVKRSQIAQERGKIQSLLDSLPTVNAFVSLQDSVIHGQESIINLQAHRIDTLEVNLSDLRVDMSKVRVNLEAQIGEHEKTTEILVNSLTEERKQTKKERRRKIFYQVTTVLAPVALLILL